MIKFKRLRHRKHNGRMGTYQQSSQEQRKDRREYGLPPVHSRSMRHTKQA